MGLPCDYTEDWYDAPGVPSRSQPAPTRGRDVWAGYSKVQSDNDPSKVSAPVRLPATK